MAIINNIKCESFIVTGLLYNSKKRFSQIHKGSYSGWGWANATNLWRGSIWGVTKQGKRKLLTRTYN